MVRQIPDIETLKDNIEYRRTKKKQFNKKTLSLKDLKIIPKLKHVYLTIRKTKKGKEIYGAEFNDFLYNTKITIEDNRYRNLGHILKQCSENTFPVKDLEYGYFFNKGKEGLEYLDYLYKYYLGEYEFKDKELVFAYRYFLRKIKDVGEVFPFSKQQLKDYIKSLTKEEKCREIKRYITSCIVCRNLGKRIITEFDF